MEDIDLLDMLDKDELEDLMGRFNRCYDNTNSEGDNFGFSCSNANANNAKLSDKEDNFRLKMLAVQNDITMVTQGVEDDIDELLEKLGELQEVNKEKVKIKYKLVQEQLLENYLTNVNEHIATILETSGAVNSEKVDTAKLKAKDEALSKEISVKDKHAKDLFASFKGKLDEIYDKKERDITGNGKKKGKSQSEQMATYAEKRDTIKSTIDEILKARESYIKAVDEVIHERASVDHMKELMNIHNQCLEEVKKSEEIFTRETEKAIADAEADKVAILEENQQRMKQRLRVLEAKKQVLHPTLMMLEIWETHSKGNKMTDEQNEFMKKLEAKDNAGKETSTSSTRTGKKKKGKKSRRLGSKKGSKRGSRRKK